MGIYDKALKALSAEKPVLCEETIAQLNAYADELQDDADEARAMIDKIECLISGERR